MNPTDERLERYLHDRSTAIDLPHAGVDAITRRARRHRRRRTAACGGMAAALLLGGVAVALNQPDPQEKVGVAGPGVVESPLEWDLAPVQAGLGWGSSAVSDGTAVYSLSTAAGPESSGDIGEPRRLYRSADGTDWEDVGLPEGLYAASLTATDGSVYAVGTAAAGGEAPGVELATSSDGGAGWDTSAVPLDLDALGEGFPGRVRAVDAEVAVRDGTTVVVVSVTGLVEATDLVPDAEAEGWATGEDGLIRSRRDACGEDPAVSTTMPADEPATTAAPTTAPPAAPGPGADGRGEEACAADLEILTWAELGLTPEQVALARGQTHIFTAVGDGPLEPTEVLDRSTYADPSTASLLVAGGGWWLLEDQVHDVDDLGTDVTTDIVAWSSADGRSWAPETLATGQSTLATGVVDGHPVVVGISHGTGGQRVAVHRIEESGVVTSVEVNDLVDIPTDAGVYAAGVGPLGLAVVMGRGASGVDDDPVVVSSLDGLGYSVEDLPAAEAGTRQSINGITVTADAIKVRLNVRDEADVTGEGVPTQRLFVGTPAG